MTDFETFVAAIERLDEQERFTVLGGECPVIPPDDNFGYALTPIAGVVFAMMGVDGVHYAILKRDGEIRNDSPVVHVSPMDSDSPYALLGHTFVGYLSTVCGVTENAIRDVLDRERSGKKALATFLRDRFDHSRLDLDGFGSQINLYSSMLTTRQLDGG